MAESEIVKAGKKVLAPKASSDIVGAGKRVLAGGASAPPAPPAPSPAKPGEVAVHYSEFPAADFVGGLKMVWDTLDRANSAKNAALNKGAELGAGKPAARSLGESWENLKAMGTAAADAFKKDEPTPLRILQPFGGKSTTGKLVGRGADFVVEGATDPAGALLGPAAEAGGAALRGGAKALVKTKQAQRVIEAASPWVAEKLSTPNGQRFVKILGAFGLGPLQKMKHEVIKPYLNELERHYQQVSDMAMSIHRETERLMKASPIYRSAIMDASQGRTVNPINELVRRRVVLLDRPAVGKTLATARAEIAAEAAKFGVDPAFIDAQAKAIFQQFRETTFTIDKLKPRPAAQPWEQAAIDDLKLDAELRKRVGPSAPLPEELGLKTAKHEARPLTKAELKARDAQRPIDRWLDNMFGEAPTHTPGEVGAHAFAGTRIPEIREAGLRGLTDRMARERLYAKPPRPDGTADPGWIIVRGSDHGMDALQGRQIPGTLFNFLHAEATKAALHPTNRSLNAYIESADAAMAIWKRLVGTVKKGWLANPATQAANIASNHAVATMGLRANKSRPQALTDSLPGAWKEVQALKGGARSKDIEEFSQYSRSFFTTQADTATLSGGRAGQPLRDVAFSGTRFATVKPKPGEVLMAPINATVAFQGEAEQTYKLAMFKALKPKLGAQAAAAQVERYLFDYSDRGALLEFADKFGLAPFNAFPTKAAALFFDTVVNHPELLAKYPRLRALAQRGYRTDELQQEDRYRGMAFPLAYDDNAAVDLGRFHPFGGTVSSLRGLVSKPSADARAEGAAKTSILSPAVAIWGYGVSPYGEADRPEALQQDGAPPGELRRAQRRATADNYLPSLLPRIAGPIEGRGARQIREARAGITAGDAPSQQPRRMEDTLLGNLVGLRPVTAESADAKNERAGKQRGDRAAVVGRYFGDQLAKAHQATKHNHTAYVAGMRLQDLPREIRETSGYIKSLFGSGRVVDAQGRLSAEGKQRLEAAADLLAALLARQRAGK